MTPTSPMTMPLYRPHPGKEAELLEIIKEHVPTLRKEGLVTDHPVLLLQSQDGTFIEIFQWASVEAIERAHQSAAARAIWGRMEAVADFPSLSALPEANQPFPNFRFVR